MKVFNLQCFVEIEASIAEFMIDCRLYIKDFNAVRVIHGMIVTTIHIRLI